MDTRSRSRRAGALAAIVLLASLSLAAWAGGMTKAPSAPAPMPHLVSVRDSPGYVPLHDPDSLDEVLGRRRDAPRVSMGFHGGPRSLDELGRAICHALHTAQPDSMLALCVKSDEFRVILWPEFPQSRPAVGLRWDDAWVILWGRLNGGSVSSVREYQDHYHEFVGIRYDAIKVYRNFRLYNGVTITAKRDTGELETFTFVRSIAERKGRFEIYSMRD